MRKTLTIHPADNVAIALQPLAAGTRLEDGIRLSEDIEAGHKVALQSLAVGAQVIKYGYPIGRATRPVRAGEWVHTHNLASDVGAELNASSRRMEVSTASGASAPKRAFAGYRRADGQVGIRNEIWIVNTVGCVNQTAFQIAAAAQATFAGKGVDGVYAFPHPFGCSQLGDDLEHTRKVLAGLIRHPNAGGVLVLGLGCENNQLEALLRLAGCDSAAAAERVKYFNAQEVGDEVEAGLRLVGELVEYAGQAQRSTVPASELVLGMKCGGSDGFSGITANPLVGRVADWLSGQGGTALLSEVPEMFGAESVLLERAADERTAEAILNLCRGFRTYFLDQGQPVDENPSPGNKQGGLTTNAEKSLGCVQKAGRAPIRSVLDYGAAAQPGLGGVALVRAPGNDAVSGTAMAAAGAHMLLFTTGRGTPMGFPVPTLKIASHTGLSERKPHWIDFDAGRLLASEVSIESLAAELVELVLATASGKPVRNELNGQREIAIWKQGVTL